MLKKNLILPLMGALLTIAFLAACEAQAQPASQPPAKGEVRWYGFNEGMKAAAAQKKLVVLDFYTDWCHWCKVMDKKTFADKKVSRQLKKDFICIRINAEKNSPQFKYQGKMFTPRQFTRQVGVRGFPTIAFFDKKQQLITKLPGYIPANNFSKILQYMNEGCYKKQMSLEECLEKSKQK
jgi:thioredoxin-related protein